MSLSVKLRFDIFKRDNFTCQYCRRTSWGDGVKIEVDHIMPRSQGGSDKPSNLITACWECNHGKGTSLVADPVRVPILQPARGIGWHHVGDILDSMWPGLVA
jgi:5-methylcytosine-specific restriction endonuclease McrA